MTQIATVSAVLKHDLVVVTVARQTACGHDCENCAGCGAVGGNFSVKAKTPFPLSVGDKVEIYSGQKVLGIAALVYLGPVFLFLLGYFLPAEAAESVRYLCGGLGFCLGFVAAVICDRRMKRKNPVTYEVQRLV